MIYQCKSGIQVILSNPESFRSNAQNAIAFARRNRPRVNHSDCLRAFCVCLRLHLHAFASTVCDRVRARTCVQSHIRACEVHLIKDHQIKLRAHAHVYTRTYMYVHIRTYGEAMRASGCTAIHLFPLPSMVWFSVI